MAHPHHTSRNAAAAFCMLLAAWLGATLACAQIPAPALVYATQVYGRGNADSVPGAGDPNLGKNAMAVDSNGNIYVTGKTSNGLNTDFLTVKYNAAGAIQWRAIANGAANGDDLAYAIAIDGAGNVFVAGSSQAGEQTDFLTIKYDNNGVEQWRVLTDGAANRDDQAYSIAIDASGNAFVTGVSLAARSLTGYNYNYDYLTVKLNPDGIEQWRMPMDLAGGIDQSVALCLDAGGNVLVTGYGYSDTNLTFDFVTVKYSNGGAELWRQNMNRNSSGSGNDVALALACEPAGNVYVTGKSANANNFDYLTVKYDANGGEQWRAIQNGAGGATDAAFAVAVDSAGNVIVTGQSEQIPGGVISVTNPVHLTVKYDAMGMTLWSTTLNGSGTGNDAYSALAIDGAGNIYTTGFADHNGNNELVVAKIAPDGAEQWRGFVSGAGSANGAMLMAIKVDGDGNVVVAGYRVNGSDNDFLIAKFAMDGRFLWSNDEGENSQLTSAFASGTAAPNVVSKNALAIDAAGNAYFAGRSGLADSGDFVTAKVDANGVLQWRAVLAGPGGGIDRAFAVAVDGGGNVYSTGESVANGYSDFMTVKYDTNGNELWRAQPGHAPNSLNSARALALDAAGNAIVTGYSSDGANFLTVKYDSSGNQVWKQIANGTGNGSDIPVALTLDGAGNVFVTGRSFDGTNYGYLTVKYCANGGQQCADGSLPWQKSISGGADAPLQPFAIIVDPAGNIVVAGDALVKYGSSGNLLWQVPDSFRAYALAAGPDGALVTAGTGGVIARYAPDGALQWHRVIDDGYGGDVVYALAVDGDNGIYVAGRSATNDYRVAKFGVDGDRRWSLLIPAGGGGSDANPAIALDSQRNIIFAGNVVTLGLPSAIGVAKFSQAPLAPVSAVAVAGNSLALVSFSPPIAIEAPINTYTVTCLPGPVMATGLSSPIAVTGLTNEQQYTCGVTATNAFGTSDMSNMATVTPSATLPLELFAVKSKKVHGSAGVFSLDVDLSSGPAAMITVEPRAIGAGHRLVFTFNTPIMDPGIVSVTDDALQRVGTALLTYSGNDVEVLLNGVPDNSRLHISLTAVNGIANTHSASIGFLVGDVSNSRSINAVDISALKAHTGHAVTAENFLFDVSVSGTINSADLSAVKARSGWVLP